MPIKGCDNTAKKWHKTDEKSTNTYVNYNMEQQRTKLNSTFIVHQDDARGWDDFLTETDTEITVEICGK